MNREKKQKIYQELIWYLQDNYDLDNFQMMDFLDISHTWFYAMKKEAENRFGD